MKKQIVIIHGGVAFNSYEEYFNDLKRSTFHFERLLQKSWKDSFAQKMGADYEILQPKMPNPNNARFQEWAILFKKLIPFLNDNVILVGHSLGGIFLAKYLSTRKLDKKIKATVLIAAPFDAEGVGETLADFSLPRSLSRMAKQGGSVHLCYSKDDPVVPFTSLAKYKKSLPGAHELVFERKLHFNEATFPELVRLIKGL